MPAGGNGKQRSLRRCTVAGLCVGGAATLGGAAGSWGREVAGRYLEPATARPVTRDPLRGLRLDESRIGDGFLVGLAGRNDDPQDHPFA